MEANFFFISSFRIIDAQYFVMVARSSSDPTTESELHIHVGAFGRKQPAVLFELPELYDDWHIENVMCYSRESSSMGRGTFAPYKKPFGPSFQDELIIFHFQIKSLRPSTRKFTIIIEPGVMVSFARNARDCPVIPWKDWGVKHTRCFLDMDLDIRRQEFNEENAYVKVYQQRLMTAMDILDFNQLDIARDLSRGRPEGIIHEASFIPSPTNEGTDLGIFTETVVSQLPYRKTPHRIQRDENLLFSCFMLDEQLMTQSVSSNLDWNIEVYH
jgi:hypothetical protein